MHDYFFSLYSLHLTEFILVQLEQNFPIFAICNFKGWFHVSSLNYLLEKPNLIEISPQN